MKKKTFIVSVVVSVDRDIPVRDAIKEIRSRINDFDNWNGWSTGFCDSELRARKIKKQRDVKDAE